MNSCEKSQLAQKLALGESRIRSEQIKTYLSDIKENQHPQAEQLSAIEAELDSMMAQLGVDISDNCIVDNECSDLFTDPPTHNDNHPYFYPLSNFNEDIDGYLEKNGIDLSGDMMTQFFTAFEIQELLSIRDAVDKEFSKRTSIINKTDLTFLAVATAIQTAKAILFPLVSQKMNYGQYFAPNERMSHNDSKITKSQKEANEKFKNKYEQKRGTGYWMNMLYQTPPYDTTVGSPSIGYNMQGGYHRLHTLGHDPILGWLFGTANILTDTVTLADFSTYRVIRKPKLQIIPEHVSVTKLLEESYEVIRADTLNLPAALFTEFQHLKSDSFTKLGLPVPILETFSPEIAGNLYKEHYDALCLARDVKIIAGSAAISSLINMIISLAHGLFYDSSKESNRDLYEVRTRRILLISNALASSSNAIYACITSNPKNLDIGGLLVTLGRLFSDIRFITKVKKEFLASASTKALEDKLSELGY